MFKLDCHHCASWQKDLETDNTTMKKTQTHSYHNEGPIETDNTTMKKTQTHSYHNEGPIETDIYHNEEHRQTNTTMEDQETDKHHNEAPRDFFFFFSFGA